MTINNLQGLETLSFSYGEMRDMGFNPQFTQDYLDQIRNIIAVFQKTDEIVDGTNQNTARLDILEPIVEGNTERLDILEPIVSSNTDRLDILEPRVDQNELDISDHISSSSQHGVSGDNVGTLDFAQTSVGGVVYIASLISDLTEITTSNIPSAPPTYDQAYTQLVTELTNENKEKINEIVIKINEIISGQIASLQMSSS